MAELPKKLEKPVLEKYVIEKNTLFRTVKAEPKDDIKIEIGDAKQDDFKPQVKIMRWDNEVNFSLRAQEHPGAVVETQGKLIKYKTPEYEVHQYELDPGDMGEDGGLEFEWVLPAKPSTNILTATIQTKDLNFFYQPALTAEDIAGGASRPDNVVGSYAVYHKTKGGMNRSDGMEYKAGKAFHIYRPKVTDADGKEAWAEINIDEEKGELAVTIDQTWLEKAVYPVVVDPTFGYTSAGASSSATSSVRRTKHTTIEAGDATSVSFYFEKTDTFSNRRVGAGIYSGNTLLRNITNQNPGNGTISPGWKTYNITSTPLASATEYWVAASSNNVSTTFLFYDSGDTAQSDRDTHLEITNYTWRDPWTQDATEDFKYSIYATYTASGGSSPRGLLLLGAG